MSERYEFFVDSSKADAECMNWISTRDPSYATIQYRDIMISTTSGRKQSIWVVIRKEEMAIEFKLLFSNQLFDV